MKVYEVPGHRNVSSQPVLEKGRRRGLEKEKLREDTCLGLRFPEGEPETRI